ncbi:uncharacterized protein LOC134211993 [Armigeres subalbatus]|uniref:uncharacterized protein LOC134211993 n=1 Tax=Armigeres subalbatus TaxID=124917 RepID=UPI002ED4523F
MSAPYDIFDNLNSYLNATDDVDFAEEELEAEGQNLLDQQPDPDEIPPPIKQKRGTGATEKIKATVPVVRRRSKRLSIHAAVEPADEDVLPSSSSSSSLASSSGSHSSLSNRSSQMSGGDLEEQLKEVTKQYNLIFSNPAFIEQDKRYFSTLKRRFQSILKRKSQLSRGKQAAFIRDFESLKEIFYNLCVNSNLMAPLPSTSASQMVPNYVTSSQSIQRTRRQQQPELINLVDSPALILPGIVNLDSDEENDAPSSANRSANLSFDSENYEVSLKVKWEGKIERISHRKFQKMGDLIIALAEKAGADPNHVVLDLDERIIEPQDTPDSIGYRISQFITGRVIEGQLAEVFAKKKRPIAAGGAVYPKKPKNDNEITLKVQSDRWKKPLEVQIRKDNKMMILIIKCAEELKCQPGDIKLSFDGDPITMESTPIDLDLEGGEVLDLRFRKG